MCHLLCRLRSVVTETIAKPRASGRPCFKGGRPLFQQPEESRLALEINSTTTAACQATQITLQVEVDFKSRGFCLDISQVGKRTGIAASALRWYEKKGLIQSVGRQGLKRTFAPAVFDQLALIALGQVAGLSLDEIRKMLSPRGGPKIDRALLAAKADEIDASIVRLKAVSRGLRHAAACPAPSHAQCPTFQKLLKAAASGALESKSARRDARTAGLRRI